MIENNSQEIRILVHGNTNNDPEEIRLLVHWWNEKHYRSGSAIVATTGSGNNSRQCHPDHQQTTT
jgi:hypothetical protein